MYFIWYWLGKGPRGSFQAHCGRWRRLRDCCEFGWTHRDSVNFSSKSWETALPWNSHACFWIQQDAHLLRRLLPTSCGRTLASDGGLSGPLENGNWLWCFSFHSYHISFLNKIFSLFFSLHVFTFPTVPICKAEALPSASEFVMTNTFKKELGFISQNTISQIK